MKLEILVFVCQGMDVIVCSVGVRVGWCFFCWNNDILKCVDY